MSEVHNDLAREVYGSPSWGDALREASASITDDQPEMESEEEAFEEETGEPAEESEVGDEDQPEGESEQTEEPEVDEDPEVDLGGDRKPVKLSELKEGYMRTSDYTKKTQELAAQRTELESQREALKGAQGFQTHMESNPWLWEQINSALNTFETTGVLPIDEVLQDAQYGKYVNHLMAENNKLKKDLESIQGEYEGVKLTTSIQSLKSDLVAEYGELVTDEYMGKLQERAKAEKLSTDTLKEIADGYLAKQALQSNKKDVTTETKKAEAKAIQKLAETKRTAPNAAKKIGARPSVASNPNSSGSWSDFFRTITK